MLIIEGSDCLGKTTMVNTISKILSETNVPYFTRHMTRPDKDFDFFCDYLPMIIPNVIQDRFHLGGLAYHEGVYTPAELKVLEGFILKSGGVIVVLYAHDYRWYEEHIKADNRENILSIEMMCEANQRYHKMILQNADHWQNAPHIDFSWDVTAGMDNEPRFPNDKLINAVVEEWLHRRKAVERWMQNS